MYITEHAYLGILVLGGSFVQHRVILGCSTRHGRGFGDRYDTEVRMDSQVDRSSS